MERLTQNDFDMCKECPNNLQCDHAINGNFPPCGDKAIYERLKAYERTGMDPEDVKLMIYCAHEDHEPLSTAYHIRELLQAEQEGRLVVLPCGTNVDLTRNGHKFKADHWNHSLTAFRNAPETNSGKQVAIFSIEEAEAALSTEYENPYDRAGDDAEEEALAVECNTQPAEEPEWKKRMMQTFLGGR